MEVASLYFPRIESLGGCGEAVGVGGARRHGHPRVAERISSSRNTAQSACTICEYPTRNKCSSE